jgi:hypothetical protein
VTTTAWGYQIRPKRHAPKREVAARYWRGDSKMLPKTLRRIWRVWFVYDLIQRERGLPPTMREVQTILGFGSYSTVSHSVKVLEAWGVMENDPGRARARRVVVSFNQWLGD